MQSAPDTSLPAADSNQGMWPALVLFAGIALLIALLARGESPSESLRLAQGGLIEKWWNDRVFYEIFIRSFQDSDGDGIGDIQGIIERLDYLNDGDPTTTDDLGITGIWLMPPARGAQLSWIRCHRLLRGRARLWQRR